jgi:hypothetical protein
MRNYALSIYWTRRPLKTTSQSQRTTAREKPAVCVPTHCAPLTTVWNHQDIEDTVRSTFPYVKLKDARTYNKLRAYAYGTTKPTTTYAQTLLDATTILSRITYATPTSSERGINVNKLVVLSGLNMGDSVFRMEVLQLNALLSDAAPLLKKEVYV